VHHLGEKFSWWIGAKQQTQKTYLVEEFLAPLVEALKRFGIGNVVDKNARIRTAVKGNPQ
jgi:hypothetical protein